MHASLFSHFARQFRAHADRPAFIEPGDRITTFAALDDLSARFAACLRAEGAAPGDRVVAQVDKSIGAVALYLACLRVGAIFVPLNTAYTDAEVDYFLDDSEPALFVARSPRAAPAARRVMVLGADEQSPLWAQALRAPPDQDIAPRGGDDIAAILYTSGTTGRSKGAMLSHDNLLSNGETLVKLWGFAATDVLLHALPIFHVHGLFVALHCAFLSGASTLFLPKFDPEQVRALLPRASVMMGVPTFYTRLLALPDFGARDCAAMRLFVSGSAPLLAETHREFTARAGHAILERYGMTEAGMIASNPLEGARLAGTVGFALPGVDVRIAGAGGPGVVEIKGPNVFKGYWRMPEKTAEDFTADGYFITGDIGELDGEGRLSLVGRAKDLIIAGGFNIYPKEIEEALDSLSGVAESAVIGIPHPDLGEGVVAIVTPRAGAALDEHQLRAALAPRLARFKQPRRIIIAEELPRNAMGKVQKNVLRQLYAHALAQG